MRILVPLTLATAVLAAPATAAETVPVPAFRNVQLQGGGELSVRRGPVQRVTVVEGSTAFTRVAVERDGELEIRACNERCPQHYRLRILVESPTLPGLAVRGGGSIVAEPGFPGQSSVAAAVMGGGEIDARAVPALRANAAVHGGGAILVRAAEHLNAAVNGGGAVRYWGDPRVTSAVAGGGSVERGR
jgi:hypothetical protein